MLEITIPGRQTLQLAHLVCDLNGTLARDGILIDGVVERLRELTRTLQLHVLTAGTHGHLDVVRTTLREALHASNATAPSEDLVHIIATGADKRAIVNALGPEEVVAIGNGVNDVPMLSSAALSIAVCGSEGMSTAILQVADILCTDPRDALDLLRYPARLIATLRA
jgi:soluble P-type ATPase